MKKYFECLVLGIFIVCLAGLCFLRFSPNYDIYPGKGESMIPTLNTGDLIITKSLQGAVAPGMIIKYEYDKELVTHRVISVNGPNLVTKGDANDEPDPWQVSISDVKGVYLFKIPYLGYLSIIKLFGKIPLGALLVGLFLIYEIGDKESALRRAFRRVMKGGEK